MNDYVQRVLIESVLDARGHLRSAAKQAEDALKKYEFAMSNYRIWCGRIAELQTAANIPIEIDPVCPPPPNYVDADTLQPAQVKPST